MAKVKRGRKPGVATGVKARISDMVQKYGDVVTLVQDMDRKPFSPSRFQTDFNRQVFWLALAGMTEYEMANIFGITDAGFAVWKKTRPDFLKALNDGRQESIGVAAHSLFQVANGYSHQAVKLIPNRVREYDPDTGKIRREYTEVIHEPYIKHYPPNVTALLKFLAAKYPEVWGDRSEVVHSGEVHHSVDASKLSKKELKVLKGIAHRSSIANSEVEEPQSEVEKSAELKAKSDKKKKKEKKKDKKKQGN